MRAIRGEPLSWVEEHLSGRDGVYYVLCEQDRNLQCIVTKTDDREVAFRISANLNVAAYRWAASKDGLDD